MSCLTRQLHKESQTSMVSTGMCREGAIVPIGNPGLCATHLVQSLASIDSKVACSPTLLPPEIVCTWPLTLPGLTIGSARSTITG